MKFLVLTIIFTFSSLSYAENKTQIRTPASNEIVLDKIKCEKVVDYRIENSNKINNLSQFTRVTYELKNCSNNDSKPIIGITLNVLLANKKSSDYENMYAYQLSSLLQKSFENETPILMELKDGVVFFDHSVDDNVVYPVRFDDVFSVSPVAK